jgi:hypothetical protein
MTVTLNKAEMRLAEFLARARHNAARAQGVKNQRVGDQSDYETDLEGIASEIAFCKIMNVYPDLEVGVYERADAYTLQLGAVDVKSTKYRNGKLLAHKKKGSIEPPDSYALMIGEFPTYKFVGWVPAEKLLQDDNIDNEKFNGSYKLTQPELLSVEDLEF